MSAIIRAGRLVPDDPWTLVESNDSLPDRGDVIVPLARWIAERDRLLARSGRVGVLLQPDDDPAALAGDLARPALVAIRFPHFTDGRGYSAARLLRERFGFGGELRAVGDVTRDQIFYLSRVGFDAFALRQGEDAEGALAALGDLTEAYQSSVERPQPLFRRRSAVSDRATTE